jgi:hypothetical protein
VFRFRILTLPQREALSTDGRLYQQADLRNSVFNEVNADLTARCENSWDLAALLALHAVTVLFERSSHPDLEIFRIFEEAISILVSHLPIESYTLSLECMVFWLHSLFVMSLAD